MAFRVDSFMEDERVHRQNLADAINSIEARAGGTVGSFTRDTSVASGDVAYTGLGFKPKAIIFLACQSISTEFSIGFDDSITGVAMSKDSVGTTFSVFTGPSSIAAVETDGSASYLGEVASFDDDGFTITYTRQGTPTGTITVFYLALR